MLQSDSTAVNGVVGAVRHADAEHAAGEVRHSHQAPHTDAEYTVPVRCDSVAEAVSRVDSTHLSTRPDTLHLPGHDKGRSLEDVILPQYYRDGFFPKDSMLHPRLDGGGYGVAGDPVPYTVRGDNTVTALLLGCFILMLITFSKSRGFILRQTKNFFHESGHLTTEFSETANEFHFQFFLVVQTCLFLSVISFLYTQECVAGTFILQSQYQLVAIFFGIYLGYFILKSLVYLIVNGVFFGKKGNFRWLKCFLFVSSIEGVALFPLAMLQSYFDFSIQNTVIYITIVIILVKILLLYKGYVIFFKRKTFFLQIILYFCALEIIPSLLLWGILVIVVDFFKINF